MATEIEHKFLVDTTLWLPSTEGVLIRQGYISTDPSRTVRVRLAGDRAMLTLKGQADGLARSEFEYPIPPADATCLLDRLCERPLIEKTRYRETLNGQLWEIDVFHAENEGLVTAEAEVESVDEHLERPTWAKTDI